MYSKLAHTLFTTALTLSLCSISQAGQAPSTPPPTDDVRWQEQANLYNEQSDELAKKHREETARRQAYWQAHKEKNANKAH